MAIPVALALAYIPQVDISRQTLDCTFIPLCFFFQLHNFHIQTKISYSFLVLTPLLNNVLYLYSTKLSIMLPAFNISFPVSRPCLVATFPYFVAFCTIYSSISCPFNGVLQLSATISKSLLIFFHT